ncbi:hypothetical protein [Ruegeria atlantica]|uniref:Uncharacterized protein n=1 Tax=Ruegeria atlantica TaxID=81569 RepID=A0A0P1EFW1_9RHOB|nr:hypothetical protein [Ruegeria atlantica]CUH49069.1 hypothetical protein RUA4292_03263 [Ruegeria atlantica]
MTKPLRLRTFLTGLWLTVLACIVLAFLLPHDPYFRYQAMGGTIFERARWIYERIHFDETPIDIAFLGSSRTARGVISPDLEERLAEQGIDARIVNFSLPASGFDVRLPIIRELLSEHKPKLIVISVVEQFPRHGHQAFGDLAGAGEVLQSPWIVNRNLPENLARLPIRQIQLAAANLLPEAFGYQPEFNPTTYAGTTIDPRIFNPGKAFSPKSAADIEVLKDESEFRRRKLTRPILPESMAGIEFGIPRTYLRRIAELAKAKGVQIAFLYLPFYGGYEEPFEKAWLEQFGPVFSAGFLLNDPNLYNDVAHVSELGAVLVTDWLTETLTPLLDPSTRS